MPESSFVTVWKIYISIQALLLKCPSNPLNVTGFPAIDRTPLVAIANRAEDMAVILGCSVANRQITAESP
jgi:hypothetical protein